jgi:hypothetical protein
LTIPRGSRHDRSPDAGSTSPGSSSIPPSYCSRDN